jgi:fumarate hydratase subunit beta
MGTSERKGRALRVPLVEAEIEDLVAGDLVWLSGPVYTARDAAHARMAEAVGRGEPLPFDPRGQVVYYVGPTPAKPGQVIGSAGPTRMDPYTPMLLDHGLKGMIGKGRRSPEVREAMRRHRAIYFGAVEGTAALLAGRVVSAELVAFEDLGTEAVRRLVVEDFPAMVVNDLAGGDLYEDGRARYRRC